MNENIDKYRSKDLFKGTLTPYFNWTICIIGAFILFVVGLSMSYFNDNESVKNSSEVLISKNDQPISTQSTIKPNSIQPSIPSSQPISAQPTPKANAIQPSIPSSQPKNSPQPKTIASQPISAKPIPKSNAIQPSIPSSQPKNPSQSSLQFSSKLKK